MQKLAFTLEPQKYKAQLLLLKTAVKYNQISPSELRALRYLLSSQNNRLRKPIHGGDSLMFHQKENPKNPDYKTEDTSLIFFSNMVEVFGGCFF